MVHPLHKTKLTVSYQDVLEIRDRMFEAFGQYQDKYLESLDAKNMGKKQQNHLIITKV